MLFAMLGNTGVINCYGIPPFDRKGARPVTAPDYHGEAFVVAPGGRFETATVAKFTPNRAVIDIANAATGGLLVYNMNYDDGWHTDAGKLESYKDALAVRIAPGTRRVVFSYRPPGLGLGLGIATITIGLLFVLRRREESEGLA